MKITPPVTHARNSLAVPGNLSKNSTFSDNGSASNITNITNSNSNPKIDLHTLHSAAATLNQTFSNNVSFEEQITSQRSSVSSGSGFGDNNSKRSSRRSGISLDQLSGSHHANNSVVQGNVQVRVRKNFSFAKFQISPTSPNLFQNLTILI